MKQEMRIGVVGLGYWGKNILRNLFEMNVLGIACDSDQKATSGMEEQFKDVAFTNTFEDLLDNPEIEAIAIATPAVTHYGIARQALMADKDVFVEKPLAISLEEGEELIRLADNQRKVLMVGHTLQYHPAVCKLKELIHDGDLGKVQYIYSNRLNIGKLRAEENILWSFAPHDISIMLMLLDEEPIEVTAFGDDYLNKGIYDTTLTTMEFANGVKGHIYVSWLHPYKEQRLVVVGTHAMAVFDDVAEDKLRIYPHKIEWRDGKIPVAHKADYISIPIEKGEPLRLEMEHFIKCIHDRSKALTDGREGVRVLKVLQSAEDSLTRKHYRKNKQHIGKIFIHESAYVDVDVEIGKGTKIWHFSHVLGGSQIGQDCVIGQNVMIGPEVTIGDCCKIQNNVSVYKGVTLEDRVFCGPSCVFTNVYNPRAFVNRKEQFLSILVKKGASIGANATIVCGSTIGKYAMVGAGAVVKDDVPDYAVMVGVPAEKNGWVCKCGVTLGQLDDNDTATCEGCGSSYKLEQGNLIAVEERI